MTEPDSTIPPEDGVTGDPVPPARNSDDPELDCTDLAHPAWWRGNDHGVAGAASRIQVALDGKDEGAGVLGNAALERARRGVLDLREKLARAEGELAHLREWADNGRDEEKWQPGKTIGASAIDYASRMRAERDAAIARAERAEEELAPYREVEQSIEAQCTPEERASDERRIARMLDRVRRGGADAVEDTLTAENADLREKLARAEKERDAIRADEARLLDERDAALKRAADAEVMVQHNLEAAQRAEAAAKAAGAALRQIRKRADEVRRYPCDMTGYELAIADNASVADAALRALGEAR